MAPILSRAVTDSLEVFDQTFKTIGLTVLGIIVTAIIVFLIRGWQGLKKHIVENIFIALGGGVATWLLIFIIILVRLPFKMLRESGTNLVQVIQEKQQLSKKVNDLNSNIGVLQKRPKIVIVHGTCKLTEESINPARAPQPCPGAPPPTLRDIVLAINAHLTEGDRNRFSNALSEFSDFLSKDKNLGYKLNTELASLSRARGDGTIAKEVQEHEKILSDITTEGWKYANAFPVLRIKWDMFRDQNEYVFGDNPDNEGPHAILNAAVSYDGYLELWSAIVNKDQKPILNLLGLQQNLSEEYLHGFFNWEGGCAHRLNEMRDSIR